MQREVGDYLSLNEVKAKLSCLSKADMLRLKRIAEYQARKLRGGDGDELLAEGLTKVVAGDRQWPEILSNVVYDPSGGVPV